MSDAGSGARGQVRAYLAHFEGAWPRLVLTAALLAVAGLLPGAAVWVLRGALDAVLDGAPAMTWLIALVGLTVLQGLVSITRSAITRGLAMDLVHRLRMRVHERLHLVEHSGSVGERLAAIAHEADELQYGVSALVTALRNPVTVIVLGVSAVAMAPGLAVRMGLLIPLLAGIAALGARLVRWATQRWAVANRAWLEEAQDQAAGMQTTRDLGALEVQLARLEGLSRAEATSRAVRDVVRAVPTALVQLVVVLALVALVGWGGSRVASGQATAGSVVGFAVAIGLLQRPLQGLTEVWSLLQRSITALERCQAVLEAPLPSRVHAERFHLADVRIPGRLGPVSLTISPGEKVALVGPSGSGKSTLLAVLAGRLDAVGAARAPAAWLRQDPWVFDRSIRENLLLGATSPDHLDAILYWVSWDAERDLDGPAGERGRRLSGGERQRLCLARTLLSEPEHLLLDEATSEVEPARREAIARRLAQLDATVVFASHDAHFAAVADRVIWLVDGRIVADGPHDELLETAAYRAHWDAA